MAATFYSIEEASRILKLHPQTLRRWIRQGKLSARRFGRQFRLLPEDIEKAGRPSKAGRQIDTDSFDRIALSAMADLWDNEEDATYDNWRELYGVKKR